MNIFRSQLNYLKFQQQLKRMANGRKAIDFYENNQTDYIKSKIKQIYKVGWQVYQKFLRKFPMTNRIIDDQSLLFKQYPKINLQSTDNQKQLLDQIIGNSLFYSMLVTLNRRVNLTGKVGVIPR